jgi:hypothetical protein
MNTKTSGIMVQPSQDQIRELKDQATKSNDHELVALCEKALNRGSDGRRAAMLECARIIAEGKMNEAVPKR